jgi:type VI secretion system protein VasD
MSTLCRPFVPIAFAAALLLGLAGCASGPPKPVKTPVTVVALQDVNPDPSGRASPVVIRLYQLKSDVGFAAAEFFPLWDDDKKVLAADLIARDEFELAPGEHKSIEVMLPAEARFVGAIAAFRDIRNTTWRALVPVTKKGLGKVKVSADTKGLRIEPGA